MEEPIGTSGSNSAQSAAPEEGPHLMHTVSFLVQPTGDQKQQTTEESEIQHWVGTAESSRNRSLVWEEKTETRPGLERCHCRVTTVNFTTVTATSRHLLHETSV